MKKILISIALVLGLHTATHAVTKVTLCYEDVDSPPWQFKNRTGVNFKMLEMVQAAMPNDVVFEYKAIEKWKPCLESELANSRVDGAFSASFNVKRIAFGHYPGFPTETQNPDNTKRLHTADYSVFATNTSFYDPATKKFTAKSFATQTGYSVIDNVKDNLLQAGEKSAAKDEEKIEFLKQNFKFDDSGSNPLAIFRKVKNGDVDVGVMLTSQGDSLIAANDPNTQGVKKLSPAFVTKDYYLLFSKGFVTANRELAVKIWNKIGEIRETPAYNNAVKQFLD